MQPEESEASIASGPRASRGVLAWKTAPQYLLARFPSLDSDSFTFRRPLPLLFFCALKKQPGFMRGSIIGRQFCVINLAKTGESEGKVLGACRELIEKSAKLVVADFNFKDVDRLRTFYSIARKTGRKLAVTLGDAFLLKHLTKDPKLQVPPPDDSHVVIIVPKRGTGQYRKEDYDSDERQFLSQPNAWTADKLSKDQAKLIAHVSYYNIGELIDIRPEIGSSFIHSLREPFNEEMLGDFQRLHKWLEHFGMSFTQSHVSGHATGEELKQIIKEIEAKTLFPIHTEHPELFREMAKETRAVQVGRTYNLSG